VTGEAPPVTEGSPSGWPAVVCQGELLIDLLAVGPDQTIDGAMTFQKAPGGAPANVAVGLARLGTRAAFIGKVSSDAFGRFLRTALEADGVDVRGLVADPDARTPLAFVGLDGARGRSFIFYHRGMADTILRPEEVDAELINHARAFHFGSVSLAAEPGRSATLAGARIARARGCLVSFDPNVRLELWDSPEEAHSSIHAALPLANLVKVSGEETRLLFGTDDPAEACRAIRALGPTLAIVTLGPDGSYFQTAGAEGHVAGFAVGAVDSTGAGDAFVACLLSNLVSAGATAEIPLDVGVLTAAVRFANAGGALATTAYGAIPSLPTRGEVQALVDHATSADAARSTTTPADVRTHGP
jgi:fructokinase